MNHTLRRTTSQVQALVLALVPHGGQRVARQNAWASMSQGAVQARNRREADLAMDRAVRRSDVAAVRTGARADHPAGRAAR